MTVLPLGHLTLCACVHGSFLSISQETIASLQAQYTAAAKDPVKKARVEEMIESFNQHARVCEPLVNRFVGGTPEGSNQAIHSVPFFVFYSSLSFGALSKG